jgi:hypothetical protein
MPAPEPQPKGAQRPNGQMTVTQKGPEFGKKKKKKRKRYA